MTVKLIILFSLASFLEVGGAPSWPSWATQVISILMMKLNLSMKKKLFFTSKSSTFFIHIFLLESIIFLFSRPSRHAQRAQSTQCEQLGVEPHMESVLKNLKKVPENQRRQLQVSSDNRALSIYQNC